MGSGYREYRGVFTVRYHRAVQLLETAAESSKHGSSPRRRAWILALQARGHAALGQAEPALAALDAADATLAQADAPHGTDFFDAARLDGFAGTSYLLLQDPACAYPRLAAALERRAPADIKGRALLTLDLAACRTLEGEGEESCRLLHEALDLADGSIVGPIITRARAVRAGVDRATGTHALKQVDLRLAELAP